MSYPGSRAGWSLWGIVSALILGAITAAGPVAADEAPDGAAEEPARERHHGFMEAPRQLSGSLSGKQFVAGPEVFIDAQVDDDIFAAGGDVELRGVRAQDVFAAGGAVGLEDVTAQDAFLSGGKVDERGRFDGDMLAAGASVELGPGSTVAGDVLAAGGRVAIAGTISGGVRAAGGQIRIDGRIGGDVSLAGERIVLGPNARVAGDLTYRSGQQIRRMAGAEVAGQIERRAYERPRMPGILELVFAGVLGWIGAVVSAAALAALLIGAVPRWIAGASDTIALRPWPALGLGVLLLFGVPVAAPVLMVTVIGIPIAVLALLSYAVFAAVGIIAAALWVGQHLPRIGGRHAGHIGFGARFGRAVAGLVLLALVFLVPFAGGFVVLLATVFGLGATAMQAWALLGPRA
jgi:hypothetical protein